MMNVVLPTDMQNIYIITWSQLNHPSFAQESAMWTKQNLGREYSMLLPVTTQLIVYPVCRDVGPCVKSGSCSMSSLKWKVNGQYLWDISLSQQMVALIKHDRTLSTTILFAFQQQLMHAPVHGVRNTVQQLMHKTLDFISPELWSQQTRAELNWLQDLGSLQQLEYEIMSCNSTKLKKWCSDWLNSVEKQ